MDKTKNGNGIFVQIGDVFVRQESDIGEIVNKITEKLNEEISNDTHSYGIGEVDKSSITTRFDSYQRHEISMKILSVLQSENLSIDQAETVLDFVKERLRHVQLGESTVFTCGI